MKTILDWFRKRTATCCGGTCCKDSSCCTGDCGKAGGCCDAACCKPSNDRSCCGR